MERGVTVPLCRCHDRLGQETVDGKRPPDGNWLNSDRRRSEADLRGMSELGTADLEQIRERRSGPWVPFIRTSS